jgi:GNAT superfamily N-acetyltransferase
MPSLAEITVIVTSDWRHTFLLTHNDDKPPARRESPDALSSSIASEIHAAAAASYRLDFLAIAGDRVIGCCQCEIHSVAAFKQCHEGEASHFLSQGKPFQDAKSSELVAYAKWTDVLDDWQKIGVATKLANVCDSWLKRHGIHYVYGFFLDNKGLPAFRQRKANSGAKISVIRDKLDCYMYQHV